MRIIGGAFRGTRLNAPDGAATRPTSDRTREAVFNILAHGLGLRFDGIRVIDVFAGTGALGIEALSRGAVHAVFVDSATPALNCIRDHVARVKATERARIVRADARRLPQADAPCALAFLDPPYGMDLAVPTLESLATRGWLAADAVCVIETGAAEELPLPAGFELADERRYGVARVRFARFRAA